MNYQKVVESVPTEKRETLSDRMIDLVLKSKNADKMPGDLAKAVLSTLQKGADIDDLGLSFLLKAGVVLEADKTVEILERDLQLMGAANAVKEILQKSKRN